MAFLELIQEGKIKEAYELLEAKEGVEDFSAEYKNDRTVRAAQVGNRPDRANGGEKTPVERITIPVQRKIVKSAVSFLFGSPVEIVPDESNDSTGELSDLWKSLRMDSVMIKFAEAVKSETEGAIVFFPVEKEGKETKLRARVLSSSSGRLFPVIDVFGDMEAFAWEFVNKVDGEEITNLYVWTEEANYIFKGQGSDLKPDEENPISPNLFGKIPVVYLSQELPEWWDVLDLIDRFENSFSKFADTNDYFAHPTYKAKGGMGAKIKKDDTGRIVQLEIVETKHGNIIDADLDVLAWDRAPESLRLEFDTLKELIFDQSSTADFAKMVDSGLGNISGIALRLMFFNSILKAKWDEGDYSVAVSRCINILIAGMQNILRIGGGLEETNFDILFTSVLPENLKETMEILTEGTGGKPVMSQKTAIAHNPLVSDKDGELNEIETESVSELGETVF